MKKEAQQIAITSILSLLWKLLKGPFIKLLRKGSDKTKNKVDDKVVDIIEDTFKDNE